MHATDFRGGQLFPGGRFLYSLCAFVCRFLLFAFTFTPRRVVFCFFVVAVVASFHFSIPTKQNRPQPEAILLSLFFLKVTFSGGGFRLVAKNSAGIKGLRGRGTVLYPTSSPSIGHCCFDDHLYSLPDILILVRIKRERSRRLLAEGGIASFLPPSVSPARSLYHY